METPSRYVELVTRDKADIVSLLGDAPHCLVESPAFLDHGMESQVTQPGRHTVEEFRELCRKTHAKGGIVYVMAAGYHQSNDPPDTYLFRYVAMEKKPTTKLTDEIKIGRVYMPVDLSWDLKPVRGIDFKLMPEALRDLIGTWGTDEAARQLGHQILDAVEQFRAQSPEESTALTI